MISWLRLTRAQRLSIAPKKKFMQLPSRIQLIRRYSSWFYVSPETAIEELRLLGIDITRQDVKAFKKSAAVIKQAKRKRRERFRAEKKQARALPGDSLFDETYAFIVDYTEAGFPIGVTWEEMEKEEWQSASDSDYPDEDEDECPF